MTSNKVQGVSSAGEHLVGNMDFWTLSLASVDITPTGDYADASQKKFDIVVETISTRAQPVILGGVSGSGPYVLKFAIEHKDAWDATSLKAAIEAAVGGTATVTLADTL